MSGPPRAEELAAGAGRALASLGMPAADIERRSLERLRAAVGDLLPPPPSDAVILRMAYAAGDPELVRDTVASASAVAAAARALAGGAAIVCDVAMVAAGVRGRAAALGCEVLVAVEASGPPAAGLSPATREALAASTRTARGMLALGDRLGGAVAVIGNAPTALLALLDGVGDGLPPPAAVIATCCGLVAARDAKELLLRSGLPAIAVRGTRGGSAVAAAAVNACCDAAARAGAAAR